VHLRQRGTTQADVKRPRGFGGESQRGLRGVVIGGNQYAHAGEHAHEREVLDHLVRTPVRTHGDTRVCGRKLHIKLRVAHGVADLVVRATGAEHRKAPGESRLAGDRKTGSRSDHVGLGDADVKEAVGVGLGECRRGGGFGQIGLDGHYIDTLGGQFDERLSECLTGCALGHRLVPFRECARKFAGGGDALLGRGCLAVPIGPVFHERDALALDGGRHDHRGCALGGLGGGEGREQLLDIMTIGAQHVPAKRAELLGNIAKIHDLGAGAVDL